MKRLLTSFGILLLLLSATATNPYIHSDPKFRNQLTAGFKFLYHFNFKSADSSYAALKKAYPKEPFVDVLGVDVSYWKTMTGDSRKETSNEFKVRMGLLNAQLSASTDKSVFNQYARMMAYAFDARLDVLQKNYLSGLGKLKDCVDLIETSFGKEENYAAFLLTSGIYKYTIEYARETYPLSAPILMFLPKGNKKEGLAFLEKAAVSADPIIQTEAHYFLSVIYADMAKNYRLSDLHSEALLKSYPENLLFQYYQIVGHAKSNQKETAQRRFDVLKKSAASNPTLTSEQKAFYINEGKKTLGLK